MDNNAYRSSQDIALDLLKFVSTHANLGRAASSSTPGFAPASASKQEDQVEAVLALYARCREAVEK